MRGARSFRPDVSTRLKKCSEFIADSCDPTATDSCCAVIPCSYCLTWTVYGEDDVFGTATFATDGWYGTIAGASFRGFWERNYDSGECEFVVTLNDEEVYRKSCYLGQSCRNSSDSVETNIYPDDGTLRWDKIEPRPLEYATNPDTGCKTWFCGDCECSCDTLCVTVTDMYGGVTRGELPDVSYPCDGPVWAGTIGEYEISLALGVDIYDQCIITPTIDGVDLESVAADGCGEMSATITLDDGTTIDVACKICACDVNLCDWTACPSQVTVILPGITQGTGICSLCETLDGAVLPLDECNLLEMGTIRQGAYSVEMDIGPCPDFGSIARISVVLGGTPTDGINTAILQIFIDGFVVGEWSGATCNLGFIEVLRVSEGQFCNVPYTAYVFLG